MLAGRRCLAWLSCLSLRFPDHAMEAAYADQRTADLRQISKLWCAVQFVFCLAWFLHSTLKFRLFWQPSLVAFLPEPIPFLAIAVVFFSNYITRWKPFTHILMYLSSLVLVGFEAWKVHFLIVQSTLLAQTVTLKLVYAAVQGSADTLSQLEGYINPEETRKQVFYSGIRVLLQFNVLQFLGLDMGTAVVYLSLPVALFMTAYLSPVVANTITEILIVSCVISLTAMACSFQVSRLQRQRFSSHRALQFTLQRNVEVSQQLADHERRTREAAVEADNI
eukprot:EG_transcript_22261